MSGMRICFWGLLIAASGAALWYRSEILPEPDQLKSQTTSVVFITGGDNDFWKLTANGAEAAARDHNAKLRIEMPSQAGALEQQTQLLLSLNADEIDGCAVSPLDAQGQTLLINHLARKMNVVTYDSDAPLSERQYYIGTSNYLAGKICHELVREALPEGGKIAVFLSNITKNNMFERKYGYEESELKENNSREQEDSSENWQTVEYMTDEGDREKSQANISEALENHDDLACLVGMGVTTLGLETVHATAILNGSVTSIDVDSLGDQ